MTDLVKFEGRVTKLEVREGVISSFGVGGDSQIIASAALGTISESIALSAQSVYLASRSRLTIHSVVMEINGKLCVGQFHKAFFSINEYLVCIAKPLNNNTYELYSVLSPKNGLLHMQIGMGESLNQHNKGVRREKLIWYFISILGTTLIIFYFAGITKENIFILCISSAIFYFLFSLIIKKASQSLTELLKLSENIFELYDFIDPKKISLLKSRYLDSENNILLESVYKYREIIEKDPYPESYIDQKEDKNV